MLEEISGVANQLSTLSEPKAPYFFYRDFSTFPDTNPSRPAVPQQQDEESQDGQVKTANFPTKMMQILSNPDYTHIVSWMPHGRSWKVHKQKEFEEEIIPIFFQHSKMTSFIRQANGWGFRRMLSEGLDQNSYYHELFLRGKPHLVKVMRRTTGAKTVLPRQMEPHFYSIAKERPLPEIFTDSAIGTEATNELLSRGGPTLEQEASAETSKTAANEQVIDQHFSGYIVTYVQNGVQKSSQTFPDSTGAAQNMMAADPPASLLPFAHSSLQQSRMNNSIGGIIPESQKETWMPPAPRGSSLREHHVESSSSSAARTGGAGSSTTASSSFSSRRSSASADPFRQQLPQVRHAHAREVTASSFSNILTMDNDDALLDHRSQSAEGSDGSSIDPEKIFGNSPPDDK